MEIERIEGSFSLCRVEDFSQVDLEGGFCFTGSTDQERSLVCLEEAVPPNTLAREDGWRAFRLRGVLDLSLVGILAKISALLAENNIGIFAISTYNTDYILTREADYARALSVLAQAGYSLL